MEVLPIQEGDLAEVGRFLHENLGRRFSPQVWIDSLRQPWCGERPNHGMQLCNDGEIVGVICAIYSDQIIDGKLERFCNPHSWVVQDAYRNRSLDLLLGLLKQRVYHFTMFTPNPKVAQIFLGLRFRVLDDSLLYLPNLPSLRGLASGQVVATQQGRIGEVLQGTAARDFEAHRHLPWLQFVAFGRLGDMCLAVYKRIRWQKMPCAALIHVSDGAALERHGHLLRNHLLLRGLVFSRVEQRWLDRLPTGAIRTRRTQPKLILSRTLSDRQVKDVYSELVALDL